ncbi:MAG: replication-associated recombination protein A [Puniceicoccales bacterium]|nr:replication-associated recombination protein A [Puniceicoccales bacterium]
MEPSPRADGDWWPQHSADEEDGGLRRYVPLATRLRPRRLEEMVGQRQLLGEDCLLPKLIRQNSFGSLLFYGPPGCGKTSLAEVIARETQLELVRLNAVSSNVGELREILQMARRNPRRSTLLFIDEIHRFNKAQQDLLLPDLESGCVRLLGATTHHPGFSIIPPLLSRSQLFHLEALSEDEVVQVLALALRDKPRGLGNTQCQATPEVLLQLARFCDGDLRRALNALETLVLSLPMGRELGLDDLASFARERQIRYDADEDEHYNTISAFIKSLRGGAPDAALYWLAKMLEGGEDPRFIARRLLIAASEDVGLGDSRALPLANACFDACERVGLPECALNLAHVTVFLATAPKSNSSYLALNRARESIRQEGTQAVPLWLRDASTAIGKQLGQSQDYRYSHDFEENISGQEFMLRPKTFYFPKRVGAEVAIAERLERWERLKQERQEQQRERQDPEQTTAPPAIRAGPPPSACGAERRSKT